MAPYPREEKPTPELIAGYVKSNAARARKAQQMHHDGDSTITREADYKGHHIVVRTWYEVEVDGKPVMGHMGVSDSGSVHYHPVPNMSFPSALDMVKKIIDVFPDDFAPGAPSDGRSGMDHMSHDMSGPHDMMSGMSMSRKKSSRTRKAAKPARKGK